jgi:hypothetical protein
MTYLQERLVDPGKETAGAARQGDGTGWENGGLSKPGKLGLYRHRCFGQLHGQGNHG